MIYNETNYSKVLRDLFCNAVTKVFGGSMEFLDFLENEGYSTDKYDCYLDYNGENYIINRETGEYINWYTLDHIGRCINMSVLILRTTVPKWIEEFLLEFKESDVSESCVSNGTAISKTDYKAKLKADMVDILDKIRAEIMGLTDGDTPERIWNVDVLKIIDKYKEESEEIEL